MALFVSILVLMGCVSVSAAPVTNTPATGTSTTFDKYLVLSVDANVPNAQFAFTVSAGAHVDAVVGASNSASKPEILAGITPENVVVTIGAFAPNDTTYTSAQTGDTVVLTSGEKYAKKVATVNLSAVSFPNPGVYRYIITETASTIDGITTDTVKGDGVNNGTRVLDVSIETNDAGVLSVSGYTLHKSLDVAYNENASGGADSTTYSSTKDKGFQNSFETHNLSLNKQTTGNFGNRGEYFKFTVALSNLIPGTKLDVDLSNAEASPSGHDANPTVIQAGATAQTATADFWLKDDQTIVIKGLSPAATYTITETVADSKGYAVSHVITSGSTAGQSVSSKVTAATAIGNDDDSVVYTNFRKSIVPAGYWQEYKEYIIAGALFVVAMVVLGIFNFRRKRKMA